MGVTRHEVFVSRYDALAKALLDAPDPVRAIATELGDQAGRLDAVLRRLNAVEARVGGLTERERFKVDL